MIKVIVVGAGIVGASTAYHLSKAGVDVTIVDRSDSGQATDAAAGIVCPWLSQRRNKAWYQLVKGGARYYPDLIEELKAIGETETGYKQVGALSLHTDLDKLEKLAERARIKREESPEIGDIILLNPSETQKRFPYLSDEFSSVFVSGGARVNGRELRNALINAAIKLGARFLQGDAELVWNQSKINGIKLNERYLEADLVIVTGGVWTKQLLASVGIDFLVTPQKAQIIHLEVDDLNTGNLPVVMPPNDQYILSFENGRVVVGATHEDEAGMDCRVTAGGVNEVLGKALAIAPGLFNSRMIETRVGFRPFTPGFLPVFGELPGYEGVLVANGLGASGLTSGPFVGAQLAKLSLGMEADMDVSSYSVGGAVKENR